VTGHTAIDGNKTADKLARQGGNPGSTCSPYVDKYKLRAFLKNSSKKKTEALLILSRNQPAILRGVGTGHSHLKEHLFKQGQVNNPKCDRCKLESETASHILGDYKPLATFRIRHLSHIMKPGDFEHISVSKILHLLKGVGLLNE
jgi:hypothetical protein